MKEDCATGMSTSQGCTDDMAVVESFTEALKQRIGVDRFRMWFVQGVTFAIDCSSPDVDSTKRGIVVQVRSAFALDRIRKNYLRELRGAALAALGSSLDVRFVLETPSATQTTLLLEDVPTSIEAVSAIVSPIAQEIGGQLMTAGEPTTSLAIPPTPKANKDRVEGTSNRSRRSGARSIGNVISEPTPTRRRAKPTQVPNGSPSVASSMDPASSGGAAAGASVSPKDLKSGMTMPEFITGSCNQLAHAAATMVCQAPGTASPLFLFGSTGVGKTHLLYAIAEQFRRYHRMRTVMVLTAEQFTNDFITSVSATGLPAFRRRYREVDALLVDDVQFLESKRATLREMLFTVETLAAAGRPLIFTANQSPSEISGLSRELAGRMAGGLVCPMQPLDTNTRKQLLLRLINKSCPLAWPEETVNEINTMLGGDARMSSGVVNLVGMLQRMYQRMPTMSEIRQFGGEMLRSQTPTVTLAAIERAVCETFGLQQTSLRESKQTRSITEPRMLAMYLSRQLTSAAFNEISRHYNQKSHTSAILAAKKVEQWIETGKPLGRGPSAMSARQALDRIESILRAS